MTISDRLTAEFGEIDIYLFDQLLRGRFDDHPRLLDAGCGGGRNLPFFIRHGFDVCAVDSDAAAVSAVSALAPAADVRLGTLDALPWPDAAFDAVICSAVLHFARDEPHFHAMLRELWRVLRPGGLFFARLASSIGMEGRLGVRSGRVRLPDGTDRFVVDEPLLLEATEALGGRLLDPIKSTNVQNQRVMTTWTMEKIG